ncbi:MULTISPECIES: hypothetical protein [Vibrio harveyi group]|uniref:hypothetical protein n=1 Tax=Vibrio harveyi group TaxID=717610 RepID=UPI0011EF9B0E|nr:MULTISPECIES: hypothetical protein [Vibrio harveyi group]KAB5601497.1 hypothetical protein F0578_01770 [Vibrio parahaemolyticus]MCG6322171.1 hypothetical protein [Vibrio alginolyticus]MCQ9246170.1 hypothetical protein [Vibrio diabolicus]MCS0111047.1 hypothetical protein [Vibrio alginolyticus]
MAVRKSTAPVKYNNDLNGSDCYCSQSSPKKAKPAKKTIKPMSFKRKSEHRTSNADTVAEQFLAD